MTANPREIPTGPELEALVARALRKWRQEMAETSTYNRAPGQDPAEFLARAAAAAARSFAELSAQEHDTLPIPVTVAFARLRGALADFTGREVAGPDGTESGVRYRGVIAVEWLPRPQGSPYCMGGTEVVITDAATGKTIVTAVDADITVHAGAAGTVTADLTLLTDAAGEPLLGGEPELDGDVEALRTGVFPFVVARMGARER